MVNGKKGFPQLETERLILRQITREDKETILRHFSDSEMLKYMSFGSIGSLEEAEDVIEWGMSIYEDGMGALWGIEEKQSGNFVGTLNYVKRKKKCGSFHSAEITYDLARTYWGRGYMVEAIRATLPYVFEKMEIIRIEATVNWENFRSARVLACVGFRMEGILREYGCWRCELVDVMMFALLKEDWEKRK